MWTVNAFIGFEELSHAGGTAAMLIRAHHHGTILTVIKFPHAHEALPLDLVLDNVLCLLIHPIQITQLHRTMIIVINV